MKSCGHAIDIGIALVIWYIERVLVNGVEKHNKAPKDNTLHYKT